MQGLCEGARARGPGPCEIDCLQDAKEKTVTFEWYLPPSNSNLESATNSFNILCNGDFTNTKLSSTTSVHACISASHSRNASFYSQACPALATYNGTSPNTGNVCNGVGDSTCTSAGPDAVRAWYSTTSNPLVFYYFKSGHCFLQIVGAVHITRARLDLMDFTIP